MTKHRSVSGLLAALSLLLLLTHSLRAEESPTSAANTGYTITVDLLINETGVVENATVAESQNKTLEDLAIKSCRQRKFQVTLKDGRPVKYQVQAPYFFPVEDDGGPGAQKTALPFLRIPTCPVYPFAMRMAGTTGGAILQITVGKKGEVKNAKVVRAAHPSFGDTALQAVKQWQFRPAQKDGKPVETTFYQAIAFELEGKGTEWKWYAAPRPCLGNYEVLATNVPLRKQK